jgi:membrane protease YdiL (CAAX protease family)
MTDITPQVPAGWYPDPVQPGLQRYWDGVMWTASTAPVYASDQPVLPAAPAPTASQVARSVYGVPTGRWGFGDVGWFTLFVVGTIVASVLIFLPAVFLFEDAITVDGTIDGSTASGSWLTTTAQLVFFAGLVAWPLIVGWRKSSGWRAAYGFVVSWRALGIGLVGGIATFISMVVLTGLTATLLGEDVTSAGADAAESLTGSTTAFVIFLLLIAFGAPFVEEIAFRGLVWGAAVKRGWSPWLATVLAAVPFALLHIEPIRVAPLLAAGLVLGVVRQYGGLGAAMAAHAVVNVIGAISIAAA